MFQLSYGETNSQTETDRQSNGEMDKLTDSQTELMRDGPVQIGRQLDKRVMTDSTLQLPTPQVVSATFICWEWRCRSSKRTRLKTNKRSPLIAKRLPLPLPPWFPALASAKTSAARRAATILAFNRSGTSASTNSTAFDASKL